MRLNDRGGRYFWHLNVLADLFLVVGEKSFHQLLLVPLKVVEQDPRSCRGYLK